MKLFILACLVAVASAGYHHAPAVVAPGLCGTMDLILQRFMRNFELI